MKKKVYIDVLYNIVATALPIFALQVLILPRLAQNMPSETYGFLVTALSFFNIIPATFGNVLNNIRLLYNSKYESLRTKGDFHMLLMILGLISSITTLIFYRTYQNSMQSLSMICFTLVSLMIMLTEYYIVDFRLKINYRAILLCNIIQTIGLLIGYKFYSIFDYWEVIFVFGYLSTLGYIIYKGNIWIEPFTITKLFRKTARETIILVFANFLNRIVLYADKILIYPLLGGAAVAVYYTSSIFGKVVNLIIGPINGVLLTYVSKWNKKEDGILKNILISAFVACLIGYFICLLVSEYILNILYPQYVNEAIRFIPITTATAGIYAIISILNPFILKFFDTKWQIVINTMTAFVYVVFGVISLKIYGLLGFCVVALMTNIIKICIMLYIYYNTEVCKEKIIL